MEQLQGKGLKETLADNFRRFMEWLKPNSKDTLLIQSLKMIYKAAAVLVLLAFSPVILVILLFVFLAAL